MQADIQSGKTDSTMWVHDSSMRLQTHFHLQLVAAPPQIMHTSAIPNAGSLRLTDKYESRADADPAVPAVGLAC